jgi:hypothetical protein
MDMYSRHSLRNALTAVGLAGALGCSESTPSTSPDKSGTFYGPVTAMASGTARTYVTLDRAGVPTELGVALTEAALSGLPSAPTEYLFWLPSQASATAFKHVVINWMPAGHPPPMIYTVPHFDFHFYTITEDERAWILLGDAELDAKMVRRPASEFVPEGYVTGMSAPQMGMHWNDPDAPERHGEPFTKTFIYGSYDGTFIFEEPMVTLAFLQTKPARVLTAVKLPTKYAVSGYHSTSYTIGYDASAKEYRLALSGLVLR